MLNILKIKKNSKMKITKFTSNENEISEIRHYPPANKEWFNSIYAFNKATSIVLPSADKALLKLLKSYFNLYSIKLEKKTKTRRLSKRFRRLSTNRILVSKAELKHSSDKVNVTVYLYNRQKKYLFNRMIKKLINLELSGNNLNNVKEKIKNFTEKALIEKKIMRDRIERLLLPYSNLSEEEKEKKNTVKYNSYTNKYLKTLVSKALDREILLLYYKEILLFNKLKFHKTYLAPFTNLIKTIYKKNVDFNLVSLKSLHLNSYIFTETIVTKLRNKKNRLLRVLRASLSKFQKPIENKLAIYDDIYNRKKIKQNFKLNNLFSYPLSKTNLKDKDILQEMLEKVSLSNFYKDAEDEEVTESILKNIKYKFVNGLRIEAAGRLTRRNTAARSVFKLRYKGNIRNMDSSYKGLSSVLFRGHAKPNVQYSKLKSKLRIGSYGIKGWVSSN